MDNDLMHRLDDEVRRRLGSRPMPPAKYSESRPHCVVFGEDRCASYDDCLLCHCAIDLDDEGYKTELRKYQVRVGRWKNRFRHDKRIPQDVVIAVYLRSDGCCEYEKCKYPNGTRGRDLHHLTYKRAYGFELPEDLMLMCRGCHDEWHEIHGVPK